MATKIWLVRIVESDGATYARLNRADEYVETRDKQLALGFRTRARAREVAGMLRAFDKRWRAAAA